MQCASSIRAASLRAVPIEADILGSDSAFSSLLIAITFYITLRVESSGQSLNESLLVAQSRPMGITEHSTQFDKIALSRRKAGAIATLLWVARNESRFSRTDGGAPTLVGVSQVQGQ